LGEHYHLVQQQDQGQTCPLVLFEQTNEVWRTDFVFDELANGRKVKTLTVRDDCSKESVQIMADTSIQALYVTRVLDQVKAKDWLPKVIRTDNSSRILWSQDAGLGRQATDQGQNKQPNKKAKARLSAAVLNHVFCRPV
jgi:transposase InsO family protein